MARTDDDTWDITECVGATALSMAMARAGEAQAECPLFTDPYAQLFVDATAARGWTPPFNEDMLAELMILDPHLAERIEAMSGYTASRTEYFDEFFVAAGAAGVRQGVILGAGLDTRAWRLPWVSDSVVYEIDQPKVLAFKGETLRGRGAEPAVAYVGVPIDLRQDWPKALRDAGFDPATPTAWSAEGLLPYLPAGAQDVLFERIQELSAPGSRIAVEAFSAAFFDPDRLARRKVQMQQVREAARHAGATNLPDTEELWFAEERADVADWLRENGWEVTAIEAQDLMARYHRPAPDIEDPTLQSVFVDGMRAG